MTTEIRDVRLRVLALDEDTFHDLLAHVDMRLPRREKEPTPRFIRRLTFENMAKKYTLEALVQALDEVQGVAS